MKWKIRTNHKPPNKGFQLIFLSKSYNKEKERERVFPIYFKDIKTKTAFSQYYSSNQPKEIDKITKESPTSITVIPIIIVHKCSRHFLSTSSVTGVVWSIVGNGKGETEEWRGHPAFYFFSFSNFQVLLVLVVILRHASPETTTLVEFRPHLFIHLDHLLRLLLRPHRLRQTHRGTAHPSQSRR